MPDRDRYEDLLKYYEFIMGPLPGRDQFKHTLAETVTAEELEVFFLLPLIGHVPHSKLETKAKQPPAVLKAKLDRLASEGVSMAYTVDGETAYERGNPVFMTEQQVRRPEDTPRRAFYARFFHSVFSGEFTLATPRDLRSTSTALTSCVIIWRSIDSIVLSLKRRKAQTSLDSAECGLSMGWD